MFRKLAYAIAATGLLLAQSASALPNASSPQAGGIGSLVVPIHGCHFDNRFSPQFGMHNHSNADCRAEPSRGYQNAPPSRGYGEGFGRGPRGGHPCHYDCRFSQEFGWHNHSNAQCRAEPCRR